MFDKWEKVCYTVLVMSEQSYLTKPSGDNARIDIASVEGALEFIVKNAGTDWCDTEDIKRILGNATQTLEGARQESRDYEKHLVFETRKNTGKALIVWKKCLTLSENLLY